MADIQKTRSIIELWPSRNELAADLGKQVVVVHRWYQRGRIPGEYDAALLDRARSRGLALAPQDLIAARAPKHPFRPEPAE